MLPGGWHKTMNILFRNILLLVLMVASAGAAIAMRPTLRFASQGATLELEKIIPHSFGEWKEEQQGSAQIVDPQLKETLDVIYTETLSRSYVNPKGERIMVSIAYGKDQSRDLQIHRPEVCYAAQGFQIISSEKRTLSLANGTIPAMRIVAKQGGREELITYWVRFGDKVVRGNLEQGMARLGYGVSGYIADGVLFRVSSISQSPITAFELQEAFVDQMLNAVSGETKTYLLGKRSS